MRIPDHLVAVVRELAEAHLERASGDLRLIKRHRGPDHPDTVEAHRRARIATDLVQVCDGQAAA